MLWVMDLLLILFNTSWEKYLIPKKSKYAAVFLSENNENQRVSLLYLSSKFISYALPFILGKLSLEKIPLNLGSQLKYLVISILPKR